MRKNNQYNVELLLNYYEDIISLNDAFPDLDNRDENNRYKHLVSHVLVIIRQALIDRDLINIYSLCKPIRELFINEEHFSIVEDIVGFYQNHPDANYNVAEAEQYLNKHLANSVPVDLTDMQKVIQYVEQHIVAPINIALAKVNDDFNAKLTSIHEQINNVTYDDLSETIAKSSNDILAVLTTSRELMKSDIAKYDALLTEHITKSGIYTAEAIEKEHSRFVQKIASDSNAIIAGVSESVASELAVQTELVKQSMKEFDNKSFKQFCISSILLACTLFACSALSSTWTANKFVEGIRALKITAAGNSNIPVTSHKAKYN